MPCTHKFLEYLNLNKLDFEPSTLIVGTFNPAIEGNKADWFYGRTDKNYFWEVLPRLFGEASLINANPTEWKAFCKRHKIAITDLIASIDDANVSDPEHAQKILTYSDKTIAETFKQHTSVDILNLLTENPSFKNVYLTRGISTTFWKKQWQPIERYSVQNSLHHQTLLTPSGYAFYQQAKYNKLNPLIPLQLEDFILRDWKNKWHF